MLASKGPTTMSTTRPNVYETLARNPTAHVQACSCEGELIGVLVHLGPITLRLDEAALEQLWLALSEACTALKETPADRTWMTGVAGSA
jgi:hypothetical protein